MSYRLYRLLIATGLVFVLSLAMAVLDGLEWLVLPQPYRLAIPVALVASVFVGIVVLSAAIGTPKRPDRAEPPDPDRLGTPTEKE